MTDELKQKAENFIIDRYKLNECYREDNAETREYMRMDVHSQYEEEYQLYLAGATEATKELEQQIEKMKWHYLVEDPKDLPKKEGPYWVCVRDGRYKEDGSIEWTSKPRCMVGVWRDGVFGKAGGPPVIGWCELPEWEIKENG